MGHETKHRHQGMVPPNGSGYVRKHLWTGCLGVLFKQPPSFSPGSDEFCTLAEKTMRDTGREMNVVKVRRKIGNILFRAVSLSFNPHDIIKVRPEVIGRPTPPVPDVDTQSGARAVGGCRVSAPHSALHRVAASDCQPFVCFSIRICVT